FTRLLIETIMNSVSEGDVVLDEIVSDKIVLDENTEIVSEVVSATKK
ncbi:5993_t:CDS:1, partial [Dentiscutata heterogama]